MLPRAKLCQRGYFNIRNVRQLQNSSYQKEMRDKDKRENKIKGKKIIYQTNHELQET